MLAITCWQVANPTAPSNHVAGVWECGKMSIKQNGNAISEYNNTSSIRTCKTDNKRPKRIIILMLKQSYHSLPRWIAIIQLWRWKSDMYLGGPSLIPRKSENRYWNNLDVWRARKAARLQKPMTIIIRQRTQWNCQSDKIQTNTNLYLNHS